MLSGRGLCDALITRPEEYYGVWCVKLSVIGEPHRGGLGPRGLSRHEKKELVKLLFIFKNNLKPCCKVHFSVLLKVSQMVSELRTFISKDIFFKMIKYITKN
jgi:hypothetical protein